MISSDKSQLSLGASITFFGSDLVIEIVIHM